MNMPTLTAPVMNMTATAPVSNIPTPAAITAPVMNMTAKATSTAPVMSIIRKFGVRSAGLKPTSIAPAMNTTLPVMNMPTPAAPVMNRPLPVMNNNLPLINKNLPAMNTTLTVRPNNFLKAKPTNLRKADNPAQIPNNKNSDESCKQKEAAIKNQPHIDMTPLINKNYKGPKLIALRPKNMQHPVRRFVVIEESINSPSTC